MDAVGPRTSVLILGDARNNNQDPNLGALHDDRPAGAAHLLAQPRAPHALGPGRLVAPVYAEVVEMHECCNVDQLSRFITRLLPV